MLSGRLWTRVLDEMLIAPGAVVDERVVTVSANESIRRAKVAVHS